MAGKPQKATAETEKTAKRAEMAAEFVEGLLAGQQVQRIAVNDINLANEQFRFRVSIRVADLVESLKAGGQQIPVVLRGDKAPYQLVCGFRRVTAIKELGWPTVEAVVIPDLSDEQAYRVAIVENEVRKTYNLMDRAHAVLKVVGEADKDRKQVARELGLSQRQVDRYIELTQLPPSILSAVEGTTFTPTHALVLHAALRQHPDLDVKAWVKRIEAENLSVQKLKQKLNKEVKAQGAKESKRYFEKRGKGFRVYPFSFDPSKTAKEDRDRIIRHLEDALSILRAPGE